MIDQDIPAHVQRALDDAAAHLETEAMKLMRAHAESMHAASVALHEMADALFPPSVRAILDDMNRAEHPFRNLVMGGHHGH